MKSKIWRGTTAILGFLSCTVLGIGSVLTENASSINSFFGITGGTASTGEAGTVYGSEFGEFGKESLQKLLAADAAITAQELEEGSVLLKNDNCLPFDNSVKNVTLFGRGSADIVYRGSAGGPAADPTRLIDLKKAFNNAGITINDTLYNAYKSSTTTRVMADNSTASIGEEDISFYTDDLKGTFSNYSDAAVVVISRYGGESKDMQLKDKDGVPQLSLHQSEKDMLKMIKDSGVFKKTVVLLNTVYQIDMGWLDEFGVDACLWIGNPGFYGLTGVLNVLTGKASPSGKLPTSWSTNTLSSASMQNMGESYYTSDSGITLSSWQNRYVCYQEGIYVGYKYYETRYADCILGQGNANGSAGVYESKNDKWTYSDEMAYPFGYGLSYSTFEQTLDSVTYDSASDSYTAKVTVKNTGTFDGAKDAIEIYASLPYTQGGVEKSAIQLVAYAKSSALKAGESTEVSVTFDRYSLASYDTSLNGKGGYILDAGEYYFSVGNGAHEALNNILAQKGGTNLVDHDGNPYSASSSSVKSVTIEEDKTTYNKTKSGTEVKNLFADAEASVYGNTVKYVSRSDWQGTFPVSKMDTGSGNQMATHSVSMNVNSQLKSALDSVTKYANGTSGSAPSASDYGQDIGKKLYDMIGKSYEDESWTAFVKQLSLTDLSKIAMTNFGSDSIESIYRPKTVESEGPEGCRGTYLYGDKNNATGYASCPVLAATFNPELQERIGELFAENCLFCGIDLINGPGADIIRTPYGGRAPEYYSEDAVLSATSANAVCKGFKDKHVLTNIKHFALNEQEAARQGISVWANEQSMREIYFRAFEKAFTENNATACMTSYNRIGAIYNAANSALLEGLVRGEWGWKGFLSIDYLSETDYSSGVDCIMAGSNVLMGNADRSKILARAASKDKVVLNKLQEGAHYVLCAFANSQMANRLSSTTVAEEFHAWWEGALLGLEIGLGVLTVAGAACYVFCLVKNRKEEGI